MAYVQTLPQIVEHWHVLHAEHAGGLGKRGPPLERAHNQRPGEALANAEPHCQIEVSAARRWQCTQSGEFRFVATPIREHFDIGRPNHVKLVFERRVLKLTPSRFRTGR